MPVGPYILCPLKTAKSISGFAPTSNLCEPTVWQASTTTGQPHDFATFAMEAQGVSDPDTLLVAMILTNEPGCFSNVLASSDKSRSPSMCVGITCSLPFTVLRPCANQGITLALCSNSVMNTVGAFLNHSAIMFMPSVAPCVKIICSGFAFISSATCSRATST